MSQNTQPAQDRPSQNLRPPFTDYYSWHTDSERSTRPESRRLAEGPLEIFELARPQLSGDRTAGRTSVRSEHLSIYTRAFAHGMGEAALHAHDDEACWVVLEGSALFRDRDDHEVRLEAEQGIRIPAGAYYSYRCVGERTTLMRVASR